MWNIFYVQIEYLVKWLGYDGKENTWEPSQNLDCEEKLRLFEENHAHEITGKENCIFHKKSDRVKNDFPLLLFRFFEKMVEWYTPYPSQSAQQAGLVSRPDENPLEILCKSNKFAEILMFSHISWALFMKCLSKFLFQMLLTLETRQIYFISVVMPMVMSIFTQHRSSLIAVSLAWPTSITRVFFIFFNFLP